MPRSSPIAPSIAVTSVDANATRLNVAVSGPEDAGAVVLLHGWPHTWRLWEAVIPALARDHRVVAPDLPGLGGSDRRAGGYDAGSVADDLAGLLDAMGLDEAAFVGIDAGAPPAFVLAARRPDRVRRLVLMESLIGRLPGAERFLASGPPWWFGFHAVPGLAETVLAGHEAEYVDWFLRMGSRREGGIPPEVRDAFVAAYQGSEALRCGFEYYRAMPASAELIAGLPRLTVPTLAIGSHPVGDGLISQLTAVADDVRGEHLEDCGHLIPLDRPAELLAIAAPFLA